MYGSAQDQEQWVQYDNCALWWDMTCADVDEKIADSTFVFLTVCSHIQCHWNTVRLVQLHNG